MADVVKTAINSNPIRNGNTIVRVDDLGNIRKLSSPNPDSPNNFESLLSNRQNAKHTPIPTGTYVTVPASGQEISWSLPDGTSKILFKSRLSTTELYYGYESGAASGNNKTTLFAGTVWESPTEFNFRASQALYFTSHTSGAIVEINYWR